MPRQISNKRVYYFKHKKICDTIIDSLVYDWGFKTVNSYNFLSIKKSIVATIEIIKDFKYIDEENAALSEEMLSDIYILFPPSKYDFQKP